MRTLAQIPPSWDVQARCGKTGTISPKTKSLLLGCFLQDSQSIKALAIRGFVSVW